MLNLADKTYRRLNSFDAQIKNEMPWLPVPFLSGCEWACADAIVTHRDLLDNLKMETVAVDSLVHTQLAVNQDVVDDYAEREIFDGLLVFKRRGINYIYDGRHRALAAEQAGAKTLEAYVIEMGDRAPYTVAQFARILAVPAKDLFQYFSIDDKRAYEPAEY